jgi:hypothetical protein
LGELEATAAEGMAAAVGCDVEAALGMAAVVGVYVGGGGGGGEINQCQR